MASGTINLPTNKTGTLTAATGFTLSEPRCVQKGNVVEIHFVATGSFTSGAEVTVASFSGVTAPASHIRFLCGYGAHAYDAVSVGYAICATSSVVAVNITATGTRAVTVDFVYTV